MSRYEELCASCWATRDAWRRHRDEAWGVFGVIVSQLIEDLGIPGSVVRFRPLGTEPFPDAIYSIPSAMSLADDGFWQVGLVIGFLKQGKTHPSIDVGVDLRLRKEADQFQFKLGADGKEVVAFAARDPLDVDSAVDLIDRELDYWLTRDPIEGLKEGRRIGIFVDEAPL